MIKKTLYLLVITLVTFTSSITASNLDSTLYTSNLKAFTWEPISDVKDILQYENPKNLTKRAIDQSKLAEVHYSSAVELMKKKEYTSAINEFKSAMKRYKRAKLSDDGLNFIRVNMALCYANSGNNEDIALSKRFLNLVTSKIYSNSNWTYNTAIAHYKIGNFSEAASFLSSIIRKDEFDFQSYVTLEDIYRNSGNEKDADKVIERMETAKAKLIAQNQKSKPSKKQKTKKEKNKKFIPKGERPDIKNLKIQSKDDHLQYNKVDRINDRSMIQIQEGIGEYNLGVKALSNKEYTTAQVHLKNTEKKLKRGKINDDGLNFTRGNLAIAFLASGEKKRNRAI